jgi:aspartyl-tRNA(Asn)/glutamyl-tRNA(Gln) amidotransferase subunit B
MLIPVLELSDQEITDIQSDIPPLPTYYRHQWVDLNLDSSVVDSLLSYQDQAKLITDIRIRAGDDIAKHVAHWFVSTLGRKDDETIFEFDNLAPDSFIELATMVEQGELSSGAAKEIFIDLLTGSQSPRKISQVKNLLQVSDEATIETIVDKVLADPSSAQSLVDIKAGKNKAIGYLVGQVMKKSKGKANPALVQKLIRQKL